MFLSTQPVLHSFVIRAYLYDLHLILRFTCLSTTFRGMNIYIMKSSMKQVYRKLTQYPSKDLWGNIMCECLYLVILSAHLLMIKRVRHLTNQRYWILPSYELRDYEWTNPLICSLSYCNTLLTQEFPEQIFYDRRHLQLLSSVIKEG